MIDPRAAARFAVLLVVALSTGCRQAPSTTSSNVPSAASAAPGAVEPPPGLGLQAVTLPDFAAMEPAVREQMQTRAGALKSAVDRRPPDRPALASAYGEMGTLLMAATNFEAAEPCLINAQTLAPDDKQWPYYLGQLYKTKGPLAKSIASFEKVLQLSPDDVPALVYLGDAHLQQGRADAAAPLFAKALTIRPDSAAARFGAGRAALAAKDYQHAVEHLEKAAALQPQATAVHYPLGMAYRGIGDLARAEAQLKQQGDLEPTPEDPLMARFDTLLESAEAYNVRGGRFLDAGNWAAAADNFRKGLAIKPDDPSLRHRLGTALYQMGDVKGAMEEFERVTRTSPDFAKAHFSLGVLKYAGGQYDGAVEQFSLAVKSDPSYLQARVQLANALTRTGRPQDALKEYERVLAVNPTMADAETGYAATLIRLRRYAEARDRLREATNAHADQLFYPHALSRLLAAAPDDAVRDPAQAQAIVDRLVQHNQSLEIGETQAMILAERRQFPQAAALQRQLIAAADQASQPQLSRQLAANLRRYEQGQPCRTPFREDELP
ncbi:MAG TPA: tetratricopeptide repeat protein [Vicinamibacterales bacterium]|jgi:tetratricopeptide (TPR) repeat protein